MSEYVCTSCGYVGRRKEVKPGSRLVELLLWTVLLIPGPFYSAWRFFNKKYICVHCGEDTVFAVGSAIGRRKIEEIEKEISPEAIAKVQSILGNKEREKVISIMRHENNNINPKEKKDEGW